MEIPIPSPDALQLLEAVEQQNNGKISNWIKRTRAHRNLLVSMAPGYVCKKYKNLRTIARTGTPEEIKENLIGLIHKNLWELTLNRALQTDDTQIIDKLFPNNSEDQLAHMYIWQTGRGITTVALCMAAINGNVKMVECLRTKIEEYRYTELADSDYAFLSQTAHAKRQELVMQISTGHEKDTSKKRLIHVQPRMGCCKLHCCS